jgi:hypothetical protein
MPRSKDFIYIPVPVRVDSQLYQHLKEEAAHTVGNPKKQIPLGPYVAALLEDRDRALYGEEGQHDLWYSTSHQYLSTLIEETVQKVVSSLPMGSWQVSVKPAEVIEEASAEEQDAQASAMAASWGADDDDE